jgi:hypothetical protein
MDTVAGAVSDSHRLPVSPKRSLAKGTYRRDEFTTVSGQSGVGLRCLLRVTLSNVVTHPSETSLQRG